MIGRAKGATLGEIMKATDWQAHSVRGFLSTAAKKHKLRIESEKTEAGERTTVRQGSRQSDLGFSPEMPGNGKRAFDDSFELLSKRGALR
jgi:hypothetical protein